MRRIEKIKTKDVLKVTNVAGTIIIKKIERKSPDEQFF
jgi:hypothetical protein